jgi:GntR family transcriptional regulator
MVRSEFPALLSFSQEVEQIGYRPGTVLLKVTESAVPMSVDHYLGLQPGQLVLRVVRLRTADDRPIALATSWLNLIRFPDLRDLDYTRLSLYDLFEEDQGLTIVRAVQRISADLATPQEAEALTSSTGSPVLRLSRTTFIAGDQRGGMPIEHVEAAFNGRMYSVETELYRDDVI